MGTDVVKFPMDFFFLKKNILMQVSITYKEKMNFLCRCTNVYQRVPKFLKVYKSTEKNKNITIQKSYYYDSSSNICLIKILFIQTSWFNLNISGLIIFQIIISESERNMKLIPVPEIPVSLI